MIHQGGIAVCDGCAKWEPVVIVVANDDGSQVTFQFDPAKWPPSDPARVWRVETPRLVRPGQIAASLIYCPDCAQKRAPADAPAPLGAPDDGTVH